MNIKAAGALAALMMLMALLAAGALAQEPEKIDMELYMEAGVADERQAAQIGALLAGAFEDVSWTVTTQEAGGSLKERVMGDRAPDVAICSPASARLFARENMLLPLHTRVGNQTRMQRQVLESCVEGEALFMAPLVARHRQMAVNAGMLEALGLGYMLDRESYPVWFPAQFYQILEEFLLMDQKAMDVWRAHTHDSAALEALTQAIFGGMLVQEDGETCAADSPDMRAGVRWLADAIEDEMIGYCETREDALARFMAQETAIFIDWTQEEQAAAEGSGLDIVLMPYPTALGLPVRSFELTGACAFSGGGSVREAAAIRAVELLDSQAQAIFGARGIWQDHAVWLWDLGADDQKATLRSLLCAALRRTLEEGEDVTAALGGVQAAMEAMR